MMMRHLDIDFGSRSYSIHIAPGILADSRLLTPVLGKGPVLVISNETIAPLYMEKLLSVIDHPNVKPFLLPDGEQYKTLESFSSIMNELAAIRATRDSTILALGGGVVGDISGFAASSYMRGINYVQLPTTLLSQVDSSVGGKTGVNLAAGKNLVGAFYQPSAVIIDTDTLSTLPHREYLAGLAEVVKYGLIRDREFFFWLESNMDRLLQREEESLAHAIERSCRNKAEVVAADEREQGQRALLNLGHTFGHALESVGQYTRFLHGEAVAIGMLLAARLSESIGVATTSFSDQVGQMLEGIGLPVSVPEDFDPVDLLEKMKLDKKVLANRHRLILMRDIGDAIIHESCSDEQILEVLRSA